jgi:SAM-dependent methyltransferase
LSQITANYAESQFFNKHEKVLLNAWETKSRDPDYPHDYQKPSAWITTMLVRALPFLAGKSVLDIGCNSGLSTLVTSFAAKHVVGCDRRKPKIAEAEAGMLALRPHRDFSNVNFRVADFRDCLVRDINAIVAGRILYHIHDDGISCLSDFIKKADSFTAIVHTRVGRKKGATNLYNGCVEINDIVRFYEDAGLSPISDFGWDQHRFIVGIKN